MSSLAWLRRRIWIAVALPLGGGCSSGGGRAAPPQAQHEAADATPIDAAPIDAMLRPDARPRPPDARPTEWTVTRQDCDEVWCATESIATQWAAGRAMKGACPAEIVVPPEGSPERPADATAVGDLDFDRAKGGQCCYRDPYYGKCKGRPFLDDDRPVVAALPIGDDPGGWLAAALDEHASIASFARATLELLAVGAPPSLVAGCQRAALDEVAHAQGCFAMAARHGAVAEPGPLPALAARGGGLAGVARDTFVEGCVGETIGAVIAAAARDVATDPDERALLTRIADDEARHAELAWQTVAWTLRGGDEVVAALRAAADRARAAAGDERTRATWREVIDPTLAALLAQGTS